MYSTCKKEFNKLKSVNNFDEAAQSILYFLSTFMNMNTLFVAKNDKRLNEIQKVLNRNEILLSEGSVLPFEETFCKLSVDHGHEVLIIEDITENRLTKHLGVTRDLGGGSFIAIPIYYENGENYGTICGLDVNSIMFTDHHIELFQTMSSLLTFVLELDRANKEIKELSVPIVPITKGVAILPVIGNISETRAEIIIQTTLDSCIHHSLNHMIIDLSGVSHIDQHVSGHLLNITNLLKLIGVTPILTGFRPDLALKTIETNMDFHGMIIANNVENALSHIGFSLNRN